MSFILWLLLVGLGFFERVSAEVPGVTFYFVRHGESEANKQGILQGQCDYPLTSLGKEQAASVGKKLSSTSFGRVYTSDLTRARDTCGIVVGQSKVGLTPTRQTHLLREARFGVREAFPTTNSKLDCTAIIAKKLGIKEEEVVDCAESEMELHQRQQIFFHQVFDELEELELADQPASLTDVLVVTHSHFVKAMISLATTLPQPPKIHNCSLTKICVRRCRSTGRLSYSYKPEEINTPTVSE